MKIGKKGKHKMHLLDLNADVDFIPDLNFTPTSPTVEISSSNHVVLDLNEPCLQLHQDSYLTVYDFKNSTLIFLCSIT